MTLFLSGFCSGVELVAIKNLKKQKKKKGEREVSHGDGDK